MKFTIHNVPQRSPEWYAIRAGRLTGSRAAAILAQPKRGAEESVQRRDYRLQLACERITGLPQEGGYVSADMQRGIDLERAALAAYEAATGEMVLRCGFLAHPEISAGCSVDGHINDFSAIVELKCPKTATHIGYLKNRQSLVVDYFPQVTHNLWITDAEFCDLVSFDPRVPEKLQLVRVRIERFAADINAYTAAALRFLAEVENEVQSIRAIEAAT